MLPGALKQLLAPALLTLAAGGVLGYSWGSRGERGADVILDADLAAYHAATAAALDLDQDQAEYLFALLYHYQQQRDRLFQAHRAELEPDLSELDRAFDTSLRTRILRPEQRTRLDQQRVPRLLPVAEAGG